MLAMKPICGNRTQGSSIKSWTRSRKNTKTSTRDKRALERGNSKLRSLSEQQHADLQSLWRQEEHTAEIVRNFSPKQRDNARLVQSLKGELNEAEHECFELQRLNRELRNGLRQCDGDRVRLEAQNKVLSDRSMKQSEEVHASEEIH